MKEQYSGYQESPWSVFVAGGSSSKAGEFVFASGKESDALVGYTGGNDDSDSFNIPFFKSLGIIFGVSILVLTIIAIYFSFCQGDDDEAEYDEETGFSPRGVLKGKRNGMLLDGSFLTQGWTDEQALEETERVELPRMSEFEVELYKRAKEFRTMNPPMIKAFGTYMNSEDRQFIKDRGIQAYYLLPSINDNIDVEGNFLPSFFIQDKLNITFTKYNRSSSSIMNYPLPNNRRDAVYFEVKVFKFKNNFLSNSIFSVGLVTCPYPYFVMPGRSQYSIAYESTGKLRINNAFYANTLLPKLQEGDVVGMGYRFRSGTIFITHNGKKLMDLTQNIGIELFVGIGAMNASYTRTYTREGLIEDIDNVDLRNDLLEAELNQKRDVSEILSEQLLHVHNPHHEPVDSDEVELHVNLGNLGFVFVEANVKKYAFGSIYGDIGIPPAYNGDETKKDVLLQKGDDLPPLYPEDENGFFGNIKVNTGKKSLFVEMPEDACTRKGSSESSQLISNYERSPTAASQNDYSSLLNDIDEDNSSTPLLSKKQVRLKPHRGNKRRSRKRTN